MSKKLYSVVFKMYINMQYNGSIIPERRFQNKKDMMKYIKYLIKVSDAIYPIFKRYCAGKALDGDFCEFELGYNMPYYLKEYLTIEELKILYWVCFSSYCTDMYHLNEQIKYDATHTFERRI